MQGLLSITHQSLCQDWLLHTVSSLLPGVPFPSLIPRSCKSGAAWALCQVSASKQRRQQRQVEVLVVLLPVPLCV
jgi:hypothetical protein